MADFNYVKSQKTADKLIRKFGGAGKIIRPTVGSGPKSNPGQGAPIEIPVICVVVDYTVQERTDSRIERDSKRMLVSPLGMNGAQVTVELTDSIVGPDGNTYDIVPPLSVLNPKGIVVLWDLQVRL